MSEEMQTKTTGKKPKSAKNLKFTLLAGLIILVASVALAYPFYVHAINHESTDDAFIDTHVVSISPRVPGHVSEVHIADNQRVSTGDVIAEIDSRDYQVALQIAQARMESANATVKEAEALLLAAEKELAQKRAEYASETAVLERIQAQINQAKAGYMRDENDLSRISKIARAGAVSIQELDHARAQEKMSRANLNSVKSNINTQNAKINESRAAIEVAQGNLQQAHAQMEIRRARLREAQAEVDRARLNLSYTRITAPCSGFVTKKSVETGNYVQSGQKILSIVSPEVWVVANFKETQIMSMQVDQQVEIEVDSYPGVPFRGHVDSIQRGTGSRFTLLPPENAAGNFIKVVQRVPVKIVLDDPELCAKYPLSPGMSVIPSVDISAGKDTETRLADSGTQE
ncbi:HlyD family secretion protein [Maridesulfovibrio sp. FT414]|uniref:HlyD family secretion protein n=1 Tax=Maridesulfovibrio sp. FT414 TaxID=2979469 RepID=UPI003D8045BC